MKGNMWCEHITKEDNSHWKFDYSAGREYYSNKWNADVYEFQFCPICGTPRPKEQTLAEKFQEFLREPEYNCTKGSAAEQLAKIAEDHFKQGVA